MSDLFHMPERHGDVLLWLMAGPGCASRPDNVSLPLADYALVEVRLVHDADPLGRCLPSMLGIYGYDHLWDGNSAPYLPWWAVRKLRKALRRRSGELPSV